MGLLTIDGKLIDANRTALQYIGAHESDVIGRLFWETPWWSHSTELQEMLRVAAKKVAAGEFVRFETSHPSADGSLHCMDFSLKPIMNADGGVTFLIAEARDINERKRAEVALRESEARLKIAMDLAKLVQWEYDVKTGMFSFDDQFYALYGTTSLQEGGPLMTAEAYARKYIPPEESYVVAEEISKILATTDPNFTNQMEHRIIRADGDERHIVVRILAVCDRTGKVVKIRGANQDVTERKRAEQALRDSETRLRAITDSARDAILMMDPEGMITYWNPAAERILGYMREEAKGQNLHRLLAPQQYHAAHDAAFPGFVETGQGEAAGKTLELVARRKDGEEIPVELSLSAVFMNGWHAVGLLRDITDRKQAEETLRESENRYRAIFENTGTATLILEEDTIISLANAEFEKLTGYTRDEIENKKSWTEFVVKEDLERMLGQHRLRRIDANAAQKQYEFRLIDRHGRTRDCLLNTDIIAGTKRSLASFLDITELKKAEDALISANRQLNDIIEFLPDATLVIDKDKKVIAWNRAIEEMTGVNKEEMIGQGDHACTVPFYGERRPQLLDLIDASDEEIESHYQHVTRKGGILYAEAYASRLHGGEGAYVFATGAPLFDAHGNRMGAIESIRDITEGKQKSEALLESQQQLADIINFLPDATLVIDKAGTIIAWNRAMEEMTGIDAADMLGKDNFEYALPFYGKRRPMLIDLVLRPQEKVEVTYDCLERTETVIAGEAYMPEAKGGEIYLLGRASALFDSKGNMVGAIESIRDITERKRVEDALVQAEAKYRDIFESSVTGIYQVSPDGRFLSLNATIARILGYDSSAELLEKMSNASHAYVKPERSSELLRLIEEQGSAREFEVEFFRKDGSIVWVSLDVRAIRDGGGKISYLEGTLRDITESKILISKLNQAQKMEAIGTLAGGIAHDFNNMLQPMMGYTEMMLNQLSPSSPLRDGLEQVLNASLRAKELVRQILTLSRAGLEQQKIPTDISSIIKEALKLLRSSLPTSIEIREDIRSGDALADTTQIHQVLMNLCTNAAHAMDNKGIMEVCLAPVDFSESDLVDQSIIDLKPGPYLKLCVSDTGCGMDAKTIEHIFDPYFTTKEVGKGSGLGLAVVSGIVKRHEGAITVQSELGKGTTFTIFIPRVLVRAGATMQVDDPLQLGSERILLVDDESAVVEMGTRLLEHLGYKVTPQTDSLKALEIFRSNPDEFDLLITDYTMPKLTGLDFAREVLRIRPDMPVLLCTGYSEKVTPDSMKELGVRFLMKPYGMRQISEEVRKILDAKKQ
jgi:PAS domain S-box-containing protein